MRLCVCVCVYHSFHVFEEDEVGWSKRVHCKQLPAAWTLFLFFLNKPAHTWSKLEVKARLLWSIFSLPPSLHLSLSLSRSFFLFFNTALSFTAKLKYQGFLFVCVIHELSLQRWWRWKGQHVETKGTDRGCAVVKASIQHLFLSHLL